MASASHADPHPRRSGLAILLPVAAVVVALDQVTKWWAVEALGDGRSIDVLWTLRFRLVRNDGAAFSIGTGLTPYITVAALAVSVLVVVLGRRARSRRVAALLGLVLGGALGNVVDRFLRPGEGFLRGAVIDFVDFQWWPVFNVADMSIVLGGVALVLVLSDEDLRRGAPSHAAPRDHLGGRSSAVSPGPPT